MTLSSSGPAELAGPPETADGAGPVPGPTATDTRATTGSLPPRPGPGGGGGGTHRRTRGTRRPRGRAVRTAAVLVVVLAVPGYSLGRDLTAPGTDSMAARTAVWMRGHDAGNLVTWAEKRTYVPPKAGGEPDGAATGVVADPGDSGQPAAPGTADEPPAGPDRYAGPIDPRVAWTEPVTELTAGTAGRVRGLPQPADIPPIATAALAGEGRWQDVARVGGVPALEVAYLRADDTYTSYVSAVAYLDPTLLRAQYRPGTQQPGDGPFDTPLYLTPGADRHRLVASFNSGFLMDQSRGGAYLEGRTVRALRDGAASQVITRDGRLHVGIWGRDLAMTPDVASVRQNLDLIVDGGRVVDTIEDNTGNRWGATLGNDKYVWRSGVGETATGGIVYAAGPKLSARTLADLLQRAGAVRAMEMDINPEWTSFITYRPGPDAAPDAVTPTKLLANMYRPADRYLTTSQRDYTAVWAR